MPLSPGEKLGPYEILAPLGAGGMGEVYKARDTRLDRTVAIKVLPEHIAKRDDLRARFEREARAVASLNHPHICTLHDIGPGYMVMELIEGETLAARIEKGALPLDQALKFATKIADALDRAHRAGVTHRDVKPQNIMLTRDGVKVLDFGLAKSAASKPAPNEATLTAALTTEGAVMGTPQYMAPEQFEGKEADARSDIWAFGAVLYEMVTGQKAFQGKTYSSLVGAILSADPPPMAVKPFTPAWLERLVKRCLAKDPEDRYQSMRDIVIELRSPPEETKPPTPSSAGRWPIGIAAALALALIATGFLLFQATRPAPLRPLMRLNVEVAPETPLVRSETGVGSGTGGHMLSLSPDGTRLALTLRGADGKIRLYSRLLHQSQATLLAGTEGAHGPFFSPAGDWLGFFAEGKLKKVPVEGGTVVTLCNAPAGFGGSWSDDGNIIAALNITTTLSRIPAGGGTPVPVTKLSAGEATHRWPHHIPGTRTVLFTVSAQLAALSGGYDDANVDALSLDSGERRTILTGGFFPRFLDDATGSDRMGYLLYLRQATLFAAPFHAGRLALTGSPSRIVEDVSSNTVAGGDFALSRNGMLVYLNEQAALKKWAISWVDPAGRSTPIHAPPGHYITPRFSPDGRRMAFSASNEKGSDIWVKDLDRDVPQKLTFLLGDNGLPVWTPDGKAIVFGSTNPAAPGLYAVRSDGSGEAKRLTEGRPVEMPNSFSPDGRRLAIHSAGTNGSFDIFTIPVVVAADAGGPGFRLGKPELFLGTPGYESRPAFSPDGHWLAYGSNELGTNEIYVRPFPGPGGRWQVSTERGRNVSWSRDGRELLFESFDRRVMTVAYTAKGDSFVVGKPRAWAETRLRQTNGTYSYDLAPDGKRMAAILAGDSEEKPLTHLTFLLNFFDELRRIAPADK